MVGTVVGLLTVLVIAQTFAVFEGQKRTTTSGADARENGLVALHTLETDLRVAGYGLTTNGALSCTSVNTYNPPSSGTPFIPVLITDGGAGSDTIAVLYSDSAVGGVPARIVKTMPDSSAVLTVNTANGFNVNDFVLVATPGSGLPCSRLQITALQTQAGGVNLIHNSGLSPYNPPGGQNIFPPGGYGVSPPSVVFDMGRLVNNQYQVLCNALTVTDLTTQTGAPSCTNQNSFTNATALASNIVNIQAQYGIAPAGSQSINCWVNATVGGNPCDGGNWATPSAADVARIKAVRIAVVARSSLLERNPVSTGCKNVSGTVNQGPCAWPDTAANPAPPINLSADPNWQSYRYLVYQTIIPLRNILWANL